ncbi:MAG: hypothetical protein MAG431_02192 [Chloroflexi bacterium]|nr:hypothetical protein [Chloroflexota bacterium]
MAQSSSRKSLGPLIKVYQAQPLRWRDLLTTFLPLGLVVLSPVGYGLWRAYYGYTHYGVAAGERWGRPWFLLSAAAALPLLVYALHRLRRAHLWVNVHARGIRVHRPPNRMAVIPWEQVEGVSMAITRKKFLTWRGQPRHKAGIYAVNRSPIHLNDQLPNLPELVSTLKARVYPLLRPQIQQRYEAGKWLYFGPLKISKSGLAMKGEQFFWREIDCIDIEKGYFHIHLPHAKALRVPVEVILNIELLLELLENNRISLSNA